MPAGENMSAINKRLGRVPPSRKGCKMSANSRKQISDTMKRLGLKPKIVRRGEDNNKWKGGITPILTQIMHSLRMNKWRQDVYIRDNFTCQKCGVVGEYLYAHHKKQFCVLIDEARKYLPLFDLYEAAMIYTPLWNLDNGITFCKKCHDEIKHKRGRKKTEQKAKQKSQGTLSDDQKKS
jgi:5-methylcytosine-specific restriction endonuclease McrA